MQVLKYEIGKDYRPLTPLEAKTGNSASIDTSLKNWVQGRQYEDSLRQVFVEIINEDGSSFDLTGANIIFEGILPDNEHKIIDNSHAVFYEDPTSGKFRFDLPAPAFAVAGQYKQAFFRVTKGYRNLATLEFKFEVLSDMVISGLIPRDYISPLEDFFNQINDELLADKTKLGKVVENFKTETQNLYDTLKNQSDSLGTLLNALNQQVEIIEQKIKDDNLWTRKDAESFKNSLLGEVEKTTNSVDEKIKNAISIGSKNSLVDDRDVPGVVQALINFKENLDSTKFKILLVQDQHYDSMHSITSNDVYGKSYRKVLGMTNNLAVLNGAVEVAVFNGDTMNGGVNQNKLYAEEWDSLDLTPAEQVQLNLTRTIINTNRDILPNADVFLNVGNHDFGEWSQKSDGYLLNYKQVLKAYNFDKNNFGEIRQGFNAYKDYQQAKLRIMTVDLFGYPEIYVSGGWRKGNVKYTKIGHGVVTQETLQFVKNALNTIPDGFTVLIFAHQPFKGYSHGKTETTYDDGLPMRINHELLIGLLQAYNNKRSYSGTGDNADYPATISADYSNAKGIIGGCFFGHEHIDVNPENVGGVYGTVRQAFETYDRRSGEHYGDIKQYSFDVLEVDTDKQHISIKRFGDGSDISYDY